MRNRRIVLPAALAVSIFGGSAVTAESAKDFSFPAAGLGDRQAFWAAVMTHFYGPWHQGRKCWTAKMLGSDYCMRPHRLDEATDGSFHRVFLVTAGPGADASGCHACTGSMGLIVLEERDGKLALAARNDLVEQTGSWGVVPPEEAFHVQEIAPTASGWTVESGWTGQGVAVGGQTIYGIVGDKVAQLGYIPTLADDCASGDEPCNTYKFDLGFVETPGQFFDIELVLAAGSDKPDGPDRYRIPFDKLIMQYQVPAAVDALLFR